MSLKQSIVIVNEFSVKTGSKGGTRGGTPGDYVLRYMARRGATEVITPIRYDDHEAYITRYMARREATETAPSVKRIKERMRDIQGLGGVAFGSSGNDDIGDISMSHRKVKRISKQIQNSFEEGKTVMKTVLSFNHDYLKRMGIVDNVFQPKYRGDYRGNIDQMKLRMGIMDGMNKLRKGFDNLSWVGVIQVDTMHVHCHLCMVDQGRGRLLSNGQQKGKLTEIDRRILRRGVDMSLDAMHPIKRLASNITYDRRNARCFIKKFTHKTMSKNGIPQFLIACLPQNKNLWRANTNRKEMTKANAVMREYVEQVLAQPDSGYDVAMREIGNYAKERRQREGLSTKDERQLIHNGRERLITDCMNGVYSVLRTIPEHQKAVRTPMLDSMSMNYDAMRELKESDPMLEFGFKLRSYSSRLKHHKEERHKYHRSVKAYETAQDEGSASEDSKPLYDFYKFEEEYQAMLLAKYRHFLNFLPPEDAYQEEFDEIMAYRKKMFNLLAMTRDTDMKRRSPESAEIYGQQTYDMHGGRYMVTNPQVLMARLDKMADTYTDKVREFEVRLEDEGMHFESDESSARVVKDVAYHFDDVKMLDLHHLGYDFPYDTPISKPNIDMFINVAKHRSELYEGAKQYLISSGQEQALLSLPNKDIMLMNAMATHLETMPVLPSVKSKTTDRFHTGRTVRLDAGFEVDLELAVKATVASAQLGD